MQHMTTARDIESLAAAHPEWPDDLKRKAHFAKCSLDLMSRPDNWHAVPEKLNKAALGEFAAACAQWRG